jgi:uncharacterized protein YaaR (DUF327 family)
VSKFKSLIIFLLSTSLLVGCGGGKGTASSASNSNGASLPWQSQSSVKSSVASSTSGTNLPSIKIISDYFSIYHAQQFDKFTNNEKTLSANLAANGSFLSGAHYAQSQRNYQNAVDDFVDGALLFVQTTAQSMPTDKPETIALLIQYKIADSSYANTYYSSVSWGLTGTSLNTFIESVQKDVVDSYSLAILAIQVL